MELIGAAAVATWLGIQTAISPCPLATNVAAISFIARDLGSSPRVLASGALYAVGRTVVYAALAIVLSALLARQWEADGPVANFLQKYGPMAMGPILVLVGMLLLGMLGWSGSLSLGGAGLQERAARGGILWAFILGVLFALSFCPVSAGLFFFGLIPLSAEAGSPVLLPILFGVGTALPVVVLAFIMAFAGKALGGAFHRLTQIERWVRVFAGVVFLVAGVFMTLVYIFGVPSPF